MRLSVDAFSQILRLSPPQLCPVSSVSSPLLCLICGCVVNFTAVSFPGHFLWAMCLTAMCFCSLTTQTTSKSHILHCLRHSLTQVQYYHVLHSSKQRISVSAFGRACVCCALLSAYWALLSVCSGFAGCVLVERPLGSPPGVASTSQPSGH